MTKHLWQGKWKWGGWGVLLVIGSLFFISNIHQMRRYWRLRRAKQDLSLKIQAEKQRQRQLKEQINHAQTADFIKSELRRHLGWGEPGEVVVPVPSQLPSIKETAPPPVELPPWRAWRRRLRF